MIVHVNIGSYLEEIGEKFIYSINIITIDYWGFRGF